MNLMVSKQAGLKLANFDNKFDGKFYAIFYKGKKMTTKSSIKNHVTLTDHATGKTYDLPVIGDPLG